MAPLFLESLDKSEKWRAREKSRGKSWIMPCWEKYAVFFYSDDARNLPGRAGEFFSRKVGKLIPSEKWQPCLMFCCT